MTFFETPEKSTVYKFYIRLELLNDIPFENINNSIEYRFHITLKILSQITLIPSY